MARFGRARQGSSAWRGMARQGPALRGRASLGLARQGSSAWQVLAGPGGARHGWAGQGKVIKKNDMQKKTCNHCDNYGFKLRDERGLAFCRHHGKHFTKQRDSDLPPTDQRTCPHWNASENPIHVTLRNDFFNERLAIMIFCGNVPEDQAIDDVEVCWVKYFKRIKTGQQTILKI